MEVRILSTVLVTCRGSVNGGSRRAVNAVLFGGHGGSSPSLGTTFDRTRIARPASPISRGARLRTERFGVQLPGGPPSSIVREWLNGRSNGLQPHVWRFNSSFAVHRMTSIMVMQQHAKLWPSGFEVQVLGHPPAGAPRWWGTRLESVGAQKVGVRLLHLPPTEVKRMESNMLGKHARCYSHVGSSPTTSAIRSQSPRSAIGRRQRSQKPSSGGSNPPVGTIREALASHALALGCAAFVRARARSTLAYRALNLSFASS